MPNVIRLHRVLRAAPEKIYRAFLDPAALAKWLPPYGYTCMIERLDAREGGAFRMAFTDFAAGHIHSFGGAYVELRPGELLRYTDKFDDPNLPGEMLVTVSLKKGAIGTELDVVQEGVPDSIPVDACYLGWQESLAQLARLVEAGTPQS